MAEVSRKRVRTPVTLPQPEVLPAVRKALTVQCMDGVERAYADEAAWRRDARARFEQMFPRPGVQNG